MSPLYQVVLQQEDRPDEVRLHDRPLRLGERFELLGHSWQVHHVEDGTDGDLHESGGTPVAARFLCRQAAA
jgi:hypothetical protein